MNKIILEANTKLEDKELREWVSKLFTQVDAINDRTKKHTKEIKELEKTLKASSEDCKDQT